MCLGGMHQTESLLVYVLKLFVFSPLISVFLLLETYSMLVTLLGAGRPKVTNLSVLMVLTAL